MFPLQALPFPFTNYGREQIFSSKLAKILNTSFDPISMGHLKFFHISFTFWALGSPGVDIDVFEIDVQ